jgi:hypothetical protein
LEVSVELSGTAGALAQELAPQLAAVRGVVAVVLGGSHARGRARPESDIDLGLLYDEAAPPDIERLRALCARWQPEPAPLVTEPYAWGPWANGGAWLRLRGERVDLIYRSFDAVARVHQAALAGRYEHHYGQQAPYGFFGPTLLGELRVCVPLAGELGRVEAWKERLREYPEPLRRAVVQDLLWQVDFNLGAFAPKLAARGDAYGVAGCLARAAHHLVLVLFAWNRAYPLNDKTALEELAEMPEVPARFGSRLHAVLAAVGADAEAQGASVAALRRLFEEVTALVGPAYEAPAGPPA